jgi:hypothetical protein
MKRFGCKFIPVFVTLVALLFGCYSPFPTKPNLTYTAYPGYDELSSSNLLLAQELGKLPELKDGVSAGEAAALEELLSLYERDPQVFDSAFQQMYQVGLPEVRQYCSPLQALFWLAEDGKFKEMASVVRDYSLYDLLSSSWSFGERIKGKVLALSQEQIEEITHYLDETHRACVERYPPEQRNNVISILYKSNPKAFPREARKIIKSALKDDRRWNDFNTVIARLNAPELIDYYERQRIRYYYERNHGEDFTEVLYVFIHNRGHCAMITAFTVYCFQRAGYKASTYYVDDPGGSKPHRVCLFEVNGKKYVMDNGRPRQFGIIPFDQYRITRNPHLYETIWKEFQ